MLSAEDDAVVAAHTYADSIAPGAADRDRAGMAPREELAALDATGLLAITVPQDDGGPGLGPRVLAEVARTIAAADPSIAQTPQAHYLFVDGAALLGSAQLRTQLFADVLAGQRIGNALAERGTKHAQDLHTRLTRARHGRLRLTGRKYYRTGALTAAWIAITALDDDGQLVAAFVRRDAEGSLAVAQCQGARIRGRRAGVQRAVRALRRQRRRRQTRP